MSLVLLLLSLSTEAHAQACDAKALTKTLTAARGEAVPPAFANLAACDAKAAKTQAKTALNNYKTGEAYASMALTAAQVGAYTELRAWLNARPPEAKIAIADTLAGACNDNASVAGWYVDSAKVDKNFWTGDSWKTLGECRQPAVATLLLNEFSKAPKDRTLWLSIAEVYAINVGGDALGLLCATLPALGEVEEARRLMVAIEASAKEASPEERASAAESLVSAGQTLPQEALPDLRKLLEDLGDKKGAESLAPLYYKDRLHNDGKLHYGVVAVEAAHCKRGATATRVHVGEGIDPVGRWPDQVNNSFRPLVKGNWSITLAKDCKGGGSTDVFVSSEPLAPADLRAWQQEQVSKAKAVKVDTFEEVKEEKALVP